MYVHLFLPWLWSKRYTVTGENYTLYEFALNNIIICRGNPPVVISKSADRGACHYNKMVFS